MLSNEFRSTQVLEFIEFSDSLTVTAKMNKKCAKCGKTVYPTEELKCLDKVSLNIVFSCWLCVWCVGCSASVDSA